MTGAVRITACAAALLAAATWPAAGAPPDAKMREEIKASIDLGVNWLRWQLDGEGTWRGEALTTATAVKIFAESHRKYVEEDGPFMRRPVSYLREVAAKRPSPALSAAVVLALAPLQNAADQPVIAAHGAVAQRWLAESASAGMPTDLEQVAMAVAAARAAGVPAGGELVAQATALLDKGVTHAPVPGFVAAIRLSTLLAAGAAIESEVVRDSMTELGKTWGWWTPERLAKPGSATVPARFWLALARALHAYGKPAITDSDGQTRDWKSELARDIIAVQQFDGYWGSGADTIGETIAAVGALELIYRQ